MLPSYLIIGAPKAGSTSLFKYTASHPDVFGSTQKELDFFVATAQENGESIRAGNWFRGRRWYEEQFADAGGASAIGEASPRYTMDPFIPDVADRVAQVLPDVKLLYIVRDPIQRMVSHYIHRSARNLKEHRPIAEALLDEQGPYLPTSMYGHQIERYTQYFPQGRLHVVLTEDLKVDRQRTMAGVFEFIGVDPGWQLGSIGREYNVTRSGAPRGFTRAAMSRAWWKPAASRLPKSVKSIGRRVSHRRPPEAEISPELRGQLEERLQDDLRVFCQYVDDPKFDCWGIADALQPDATDIR